MKQWSKLNILKGSVFKVTQVVPVFILNIIFAQTCKRFLFYSRHLYKVKYLGVSCCTVVLSTFPDNSLSNVQPNGPPTSLGKPKNSSHWPYQDTFQTALREHVKLYKHSKAVGSWRLLHDRQLLWFQGQEIQRLKWHYSMFYIINPDSSHINTILKLHASLLRGIIENTTFAFMLLLWDGNGITEHNFTWVQHPLGKILSFGPLFQVVVANKPYSRQIMLL